MIVIAYVLNRNSGGYIILKKIKKYNWRLDNYKTIATKIKFNWKRINNARVSFILFWHRWFSFQEKKYLENVHRSDCVQLDQEK